MNIFFRYVTEQNNNNENKYEFTQLGYLLQD